MPTAKKVKWQALGAPPQELRISTTLASGQCFTWIPSTTIPGLWTGVFENRLVSLLSKPHDTFYYVHFPDPRSTIEETNIHEQLRNYFQLNVSLTGLYKKWSEDDNFSKKSKHFPGLRVLKQDPH